MKSLLPYRHEASNLLCLWAVYSLLSWPFISLIAILIVASLLLTQRQTQPSQHWRWATIPVVALSAWLVPQGFDWVIAAFLLVCVLQSLWFRQRQTHTALVYPLCLLTVASIHQSDYRIWCAALLLMALWLLPQTNKQKQAWHCLKPRLLLILLPALILSFTAYTLLPRFNVRLFDLALIAGLPVQAKDIQAQDRRPGEPLNMAAQSTGEPDYAGAVLFAEFEGAIPPRQERYWRGPVYWHFHDNAWWPRENWGSRRQRLKTALDPIEALSLDDSNQENDYRYHLTLLPHEAVWLYALEHPSQLAPSTYLTVDGQLLNLNPVRHKLHLSLSASPQQHLVINDRQSSATSTEQATPSTERIQQVIETLKRQYLSVFRWHKNALGGLTNADLQQLESALNRPTQTKRTINTLQLNTQLALQLKQQSIVVRLVSGFYGGTKVASTQTVLVQSADRHYWLEYWHAERGWQRLDAARWFDNAIDGDVDGFSASTQGLTATQTKPEDSVNLWHCIINYNVQCQEQLLSALRLSGQVWWVRILLFISTIIAMVLLMYGLVAYLQKVVFKQQSHQQQHWSPWPLVHQKLAAYDIHLPVSTAPLALQKACLNIADGDTKKSKLADKIQQLATIWYQPTSAQSLRIKQAKKIINSM